MHRILRRVAALLLIVSVVGSSAVSSVAAEFSIATFTADVTVPKDHGMMGGLWKSKSVADPLYAKGVVLLGGERPVVFVSVDWCEIRNEAFDRWRDVLAEAAGTTRERALVSAIHQHDAPVADIEIPEKPKHVRIHDDFLPLAKETPGSARGLRAVFDALSQVESPEDVAERRGVNVFRI